MYHMNSIFFWVNILAVPLGTASSTTIASYLLGLWSRAHRHSLPAPAPAPAPAPETHRK